MATQCQKIKHPTDKSIQNIRQSVRQSRRSQHPEGQTLNPKTASPLGPAVGMAAAAKMAKASDVEQLSGGWYVGRRVAPIETVVPWYIVWLLQKIYFRYRFALAGYDEEQKDCFGVEAQAFCTTKERAMEMVRGKPGWFYHFVPINVSLPDETVQFVEHNFPESEASEQYKKMRFPTVAVPKAKLESDIESVRTLEYKIECLQHSLNGANK